ncbi:hypothetical protein MNBD_GAMMA22-2922 [hydrothermal vent metagenome]|uniref:Uncharacterized protein n=1 Tax=hydrothermal vent metagenome TaxID=652676 RepID=A0A3B1B3Y6_9ZZZZ
MAWATEYITKLKNGEICRFEHLRIQYSEALKQDRFAR